MGINTPIEYCDSSINPVMGCNGCELYNKNRPDEENTCYAAELTRRYAGLKGWPKSFDEPTFFPGRIEQACRWPDLTGKDRPDKPWLNGAPRVIFLNDLSDSFTEDLDLEWSKPYIEMMKQSPHVWLWLTKRPRRMARFFLDIIEYVPENFHLGTTVTSQKTVWRIPELFRLREIAPEAVLWVSAEPLLGPVDFDGYLGDLIRLNDDFTGTGINCVRAGGESGKRARPTHPDWLRSIRNQCLDANVPFALKQLGEWTLCSQVAGKATDFGVLSPEGEWYHLHTGWNGRDIDPDTGEAYMVRVGKKAAGRMLDGQTWDEFPTI